MEYIWLFPGTFDPITLGHELTIRRASRLCDRLIVCVIDNYNKKPIFTVSERISFIKTTCKDLANVNVEYVPIITAEYAKEIGCNTILRGIRTAEEFDKERILANYYHNTYPEVETIFLPSTNEKKDMTSSTLLKDIAFHNGDLSTIVNAQICDEVKKKFNTLKEESK